MGFCLRLSCYDLPMVCPRLPGLVGSNDQACCGDVGRRLSAMMDWVWRLSACKRKPSMHTREDTYVITLLPCGPMHVREGENRIRLIETADVIEWQAYRESPCKDEQLPNGP